ncbi:MAG: diaminobutyrate acetyltransferase [Pseudomonadales bacterium]|nr:diaminobutyrate acetyltransferase [Pseudomonadales bacterium]
MNFSAGSPATDNQPLYYVEPTGEQGHQVTSLIKRCPPLDTNSAYCNLLQCHHFSSTSCAVITARNELVGFVSGYLIPDKEPDTLFIWQVAVDTSIRGQGIGQKMILNILSRKICRHTRFLETTVTEANTASEALFSKLASTLRSPEIEKSMLFDKQKHFLGLHDSEVLYRIGPFSQPTSTL